jgi:hypothetical protein
VCLSAHPDSQSNEILSEVLVHVHIACLHRTTTQHNTRYFIRGQNERAAAGDHVVAARRRAKLQPFDVQLKKFRHREALSAALATGQAEVVASVVSELMARGSLQQVCGWLLLRVWSLAGVQHHHLCEVRAGMPQVFMQGSL